MIYVENLPSDFSASRRKGEVLNMTWVAATLVGVHEASKQQNVVRGISQRCPESDHPENNCRLLFFFPTYVIMWRVVQFRGGSSASGGTGRGVGTCITAEWKWCCCWTTTAACELHWCMGVKILWFSAHRILCKLGQSTQNCIVVLVILVLLFGLFSLSLWRTKDVYKCAQKL